MQQTPGTKRAQILALVDHVSPREYSLTSEPCVVGRDETCHIFVNTKITSRAHAKIEHNGPRYILNDIGSTNGTFVNGRRITGSHLLVHDDRIGLGSADAVLYFFDPDRTAIAETRLWYDEKDMAFFYGQTQIELTPAQLRLLLHFYKHVGEVCTREMCAYVLWQREYDPNMDGDTLDQAISSLRGALRKVDPSAGELVRTRRGIGYELAL